MKKLTTSFKKFVSRFPWSRIWFVLLAVCILVAIAIRVIYTIEEQSKVLEDAGGGQGTSSTAPSTENEEGEDDESAFQGETTTCEDGMTPEAYEAFVTRVMDYEELFLSPSNTPARTEGLAGLTTSKYQDDHEGGEVEGSDLTLTLERAETAVSCTPSQDGLTRNVSVLSVVTTSYVDEDGQSVTVLDKQTLPNAHASTWIQDGETWKVDQEQ